MRKPAGFKTVTLCAVVVALAASGCARNYKPVQLADGREVVYLHSYDIDPRSNAGVFIPFGSLAADLALRAVAAAAALNAASDLAQPWRTPKVLYTWSDAPEHNTFMEIKSRTLWEGADQVKRRSWVEVRYDDIGEYFVPCTVPGAPDSPQDGEGPADTGESKAGASD